MKHVCIIIALLALALLSGCRTNRPSVKYLPFEATTNTRIVHTETIDTIYVDIPAQSAERTTPGKESHLETDYAESDARINENGTLTHTLCNKPTKHPVPVKNATDTVYVGRMIEKPVPVEVPKEVERELTWWQRTRLNTWGWLAIALILCIGYIFRRPITTLARRLLANLTHQ